MRAPYCLDRRIDRQAASFGNLISYRYVGLLVKSKLSSQKSVTQATKYNRPRSMKLLAAPLLGTVTLLQPPPLCLFARKPVPVPFKFSPSGNSTRV